MEWARAYSWELLHASRSALLKARARAMHRGRLGGSQRAGPPGLWLITRAVLIATLTRAGVIAALSD